MRSLLTATCILVVDVLLLDRATVLHVSQNMLPQTAY